MNEQELLENGYKKYSGEKIDVFFNKDICVHAAECLRGNSDVFKIGRRPWVLPDAADPDEVARIVDKCPAQALAYIKK